MRLSERLRGTNAVLSGNFLVLLLTWILMYSTQPIADTYSSLYFLNLGASPFVLSVMFFIGSLSIALVQFPGGYLADKHGRRWLIGTMSFGLALGYLFFIFAPSWEFIVLGMVIQNLCLIYMPAMMALMLDSLDPNKRGTGFNFQSVLVSLISLPAPLIAASLVLVNGEYIAPQSNMGMKLAYTIVFVAYLIAAFLRLKLKETLSNGNNGRPRLFEAFREYPKVVRESWLVWGRVPRSAFYLFLSTIGINSLVASCHIYFVVYATDILKISGSTYAWVMAFMYLSIAVPSILAGVKMDSVGRKQFLILGYIMYIPSMLMFVVATNFYLMLGAFFLFGLGNMLRVNSSQVLLGDLIPRELRGKAVGFLQFFLYVAQALVYLLAGFLYEYVAPWLPFVLLGVAAVPFGLLAAIKISEPQNKEI
ncbi:MAG: MFS transporter [Candidatus Bathyarchaeia archaeon]|jgi:MFS family permease